MSILICCTNYYNYIEIRKSVTEKDPTLGGIIMMPPAPVGTNAAATDMEHHPTATTVPEYGTMEDDTKPSLHNNNYNHPQQYHSTLTETEREVLQQQLYQSRQRMYQKCSIQCFLMFLLLLFVLKCNGATFTAFFILLPFLLLVRTKFFIEYLSNCDNYISPCSYFCLDIHMFNVYVIGRYNSLLYWMCHFWCNGWSCRWNPLSRCRYRSIDESDYRE